MSWHTFQAADGSGQTYGSFEAFYIGNDGSAYGFTYLDPDSGEELRPGWYWWACHPGCMPDSDPDGPYATEREAIQAGQDCP